MSIAEPMPDAVALRRRSGQRRPRRGYRPSRVSRESIENLHAASTAAKVQGRKWKRAHHRHLFLLDTAIIIVVVAIAEIIRFTLLSSDYAYERTNWQQVTVLSVILAIAWIIVLELQQSRDVSLVGIGVEEYRRVVSATVWVFGALAVAALLFKVEMSRGFLALALPMGLVGLILGRHVARRHLAQRRAEGRYITRVLVLGKADAVVMLADSFGRNAEAGYRVVGACMPDFDGEIAEELAASTGFVPILGDDESVLAALALTNADALVVAAVEHLGHQKTKELLWQLESTETELIVMPGMTDIAGPRLSMRPLDNLPLFHIAPSRKAGPSALAKRAFDLAFGAVAVLAALPVMAIAALLIKMDDGGPVIFRQVRVGYQGRRFRILKFRTMATDAEAAKDAQRAASGSTGVFFKSACDSRVTRVGKFLRATSIDELPQLFNVLRGTMSIVGPRPLVPGEGESVEYFVERRGLMKPGITGLWQISGRSDLSESERIRLDYSYVDNWSYVLDLVIVWRTIRAVLNRQGAY